METEITKLLNELEETIKKEDSTQDFEHLIFNLLSKLKNVCSQKNVNFNDLIKKNFLSCIKHLQFQSVKVMIGFDAPIEAGLKELESIQRDSEEKKIKYERLKIYMESRYKWQNEIGKKNKISINRLMLLMMEGFKNIKATKNEVILIFGQSQRGKVRFSKKKK